METKFSKGYFAKSSIKMTCFWGICKYGVS